MGISYYDSSRARRCTCRISACYVETVKPGLFKRTESPDIPLSSPDERDQLRSRTESVLSGTVEATGIVYVHSGEKWHYVWVED